MNQSVLLIVLGLMFAFSNGYRDSSSIVATIVSTRTLSPNKAFSLCAISEFIGALFIGTAVASTVGLKIAGGGWIANSNDTILISIVALSAAFMWGVISWWRAWSTSNSHALLGGLTGASWAVWGFGHVQNKVVLTVIVVLMVSPLLGFFLSWGTTFLFRWMGGWLTNRAKPVAEALHVLSCLAVACVHGSNNGQLVLGALLPVIVGAPTLRLFVALTLSVGVLLGGRRILKKLGMQFYRLQHTQGLSVELASAGTVMACCAMGFPISSTQVIAGSLMGAAVAENPRRARWMVAHEIVISWLVTFPIAAVFAYGLLLLVRLVGL